MTKTLPMGIALVVSTIATIGAQAVLAGKTASGIAYDRRGSGPVVVLITGSNLDRRMWDREAEWLASRFTVVRYDLRAHGQSDTATTPFSHTEDLLSVLDALQIKQATLVGLSAGSVIAVDAALQWPNRIERVIVAAPGISGYVPKDRPAFSADLAAALKAGDYQKAAEVMLATPVFAVPPSSQALVRQMVTENNRLWTVPRELMKVPSAPAINRLAELKQPLLILVGEHDIAASLEQAEILAKHVRGARLVKIAGGGHMLNLTSPPEFRKAVEEFLNSRASR